MKQFFLLPAALLLAAFTAVAQHEPLQHFIDVHKQEPAFTYAFLSKDLFEVAIEADVAEKDWQKLHNVVKNIGSLSILAADSLRDAPALYREARAAVPESDFDELLTVRDNDDRVHIWARSEDDRVSDLVLLVGTADELVLICFSGQLELGNLGELARLFDAGAAGQLAQTAETLSAGFHLSPNPSRGEFRLSLDDESDAPVLLSLIDRSGRLVSEQRLSGERVQEVRLQGVPAGHYWAQLRTRKGKLGVQPLQITF